MPPCTSACWNLRLRSANSLSMVANCTPSIPGNCCRGRAGSASCDGDVRITKTRAVLSFTLLRAIITFAISTCRSGTTCRSRPNITSKPLERTASDSDTLDSGKEPPCQNKNPSRGPVSTSIHEVPRNSTSASALGANRSSVGGLTSNLGHAALRIDGSKPLRSLAPYKIQWHETDRSNSGTGLSTEIFCCIFVGGCRY